MQIEISLEAGDCRTWLSGLAAGLAARGHRPGFRIRPGGGDSRALALLRGFERRLYGDSDPFAPLDPGRLPAPEGPAEIRLELSGLPAADRSALHLAVDGEAGIRHLAPALLAGRNPHLAIRDGSGIRAAGMPAIEAPDRLLRALPPVLARIVTLAGMAFAGMALTDRSCDGGPGSPAEGMPAAGPVSAAGAFGFAAAALGARLARRLGLGTPLAEHWRVGIRPRAPRPPFSGENGIEGFRFLPDDGQRYYADPILWEQAGRTCLFVEDYPYATGRGVIAYTELDPEGVPLFVPRPILAREGHLSYPFLFAHAGEIYMIPENAAEGHLPLYRARIFPEHWEYLGPLIAEPLHDATLLRHGAAWWILANTTPDGGSSWDCLALYRAESPLGPFTRQPADPVLIDARLARSAGPVLEEEDMLVRPVQDCLGGYGRGLRFCAIERLDEAGFRQREIGRIAGPAGRGIAGIHTYARSARFEAIDALTPRERPL
ncbi:MAG: hypothetical protein ACK4YX_02435 [Rhabdaerophilum calidifontis]